MGDDKKETKKEDDPDAAAVIVDSRVMWFEDKVCAAFKIKADKFKKLISVGENVYVNL
jgi:dynein heavy chain